MHVCLLPTETLLGIFATIYEDSTTISCATSTLAALARTCRTFKEPALDILWQQLNGFEPLISCFPEGVRNRNMQGNLTLNRPPFPREWKIFGQYAHRVRCLSIDSMDLDAIDDRILQTLMSAPPPTLLLPDLRSLCWRDDRECFFPLLRTLLVSTITSLKLGSVCMPKWTPSFAKSALLASLGVRCPSIQDFSCFNCDDSQGSSDVICEAVCGWQKLCQLRTGVLNTQALLHLASLSSLKSLHFRTCDFNDMQSNSTPTFTYQLNDMSIAASSPSALTRHLRNLRFLSCRSVMLFVDENDVELPYDPLELPELIISLSERFFPALERLVIDFGFEHKCLARTDHRFAHTFDVVAPLLSLSHLKILDIPWFCTSAIDDNSLKRMAQSWPQLEEFHFGGGTCWLVPPSLTFIGLVHLIQHCRRLRSIEMTFHASSIDTNSELFSKIIPNTHITSIDVGLSPIADPLAVACQLHTLLPNLTNIDCVLWLDHLPDLPPIFDHLGDEWDRVNGFLEVLTTGAEMRKKIDQGP
ncbi:hypothetical protein EV702DRAFT_247715 [Suillus placidus]|uniref:F-box domain-containing protein n=1 Tax=Suillus placidus TaxID=48579 RepID=A0A9P7A6X6_9AGAM|nr:hypothetical protein EV702DRAFT_247715 [Suillus placidus]